MVENESVRSGNPLKKQCAEEQSAWDNLVLKLGLENTWLSDDFDHKNSLTFSWSNKQQANSHRLAQLDRYYVGEWAKTQGGRVRILEGYNTLPDHLPVQLELRLHARHYETDRQF